MDVMGDKGRADKRGELFLHALAKSLHVLIREHVLMIRRGFLLRLATGP